MTVTKLRPPKTVLVPQIAIEQASILLQSLPQKPKQQLSLREAIQEMQAPIQAAVARGYSYEEITQSLQGKGINISVSTLKSYLSAGKRQAAEESATPVKTRKRRAKSHPLEEPTAIVPEEAIAVGEVETETAETVPAHEELSPLPDSEAIDSPELSEAAEAQPEITPRQRGRTSGTNAGKAATTRSKASSQPAQTGRSSTAKSTTRTPSSRGRKKTSN